MFGIFLFLTYYLQQTLGYSPLVTGVAFLPWSGCLIVLANLSTIVLLPRVGPKPQDAGVASATVTVGQMLGGSVGTSLLNTIFASAVTSYIGGHVAASRLIGRPALTGLALVHGYDTGFWWIAGIFACGAAVGGLLLRRGPLGRPQTRPAVPGGLTMAQAGPNQEEVP